MKTAIKEVYLTLDEFEKDLELCLIIKKYPNKHKSYYVCEYWSPSLYSHIVHIYIKK
jgi:hypothetical protein